jgi:hypothetical protein
MPNQNSGQITRDKIDAMLMASGWMVDLKVMRSWWKLIRKPQMHGRGIMSF